MEKTLNRLKNLMGPSTQGLDVGKVGEVVILRLRPAKSRKAITMSAVSRKRLVSLSWKFHHHLKRLVNDQSGLKTVSFLRHKTGQEIRLTTLNQTLGFV